MFSALLQPRPKHSARTHAGRLLVAVLLLWLQAATPFAHAMLHASSAQATQAQLDRGTDHTWNSVSNTTSPEEKPCALCAADHLPALLKRASVGFSAATARARVATLSASTLSSRPLDLFCRPPPSL